jgi:AraC-like DNA-binding protein
MHRTDFATVSALQILPIAEAFATLGLDVETILKRAGLPPRAQLDRHARVAIDAELAFWALAVEQSGDRTLGLRAADHVPRGALGSFEYLLWYSETLEELIARARRYGRVLDDLARLDVSISDEVATVRISRVGDYPVPPAGTECLFAVTLTSIRRIWPDFRPLRVSFSHTGPRDHALYERQFGCPVRFGASANEISCDAALLQRAAAASDPALGRVLQDHTERLLSELPAHDSLLEKARDTLRALLAQGCAQPGALAHALGLGERTLRRRLQSEGTSFQMLLDELRRQLALSNVKHGSDSLEQLAEKLGFSDVSAFYRAFKRWTGTTPAQYRNQR